jgi:hypothetical protein
MVVIQVPACRRRQNRLSAAIVESPWTVGTGTHRYVSAVSSPISEGIVPLSELSPKFLRRRHRVLSTVKVIPGAPVTPSPWHLGDWDSQLCQRRVYPQLRRQKSAEIAADKVPAHTRTGW